MVSTTAGHPSCVVTVCQCAGRGRRAPLATSLSSEAAAGESGAEPGLYLLPRAGLACSHCQILLSNIISAERGRERAINGCEAELRPVTSDPVLGREGAPAQ